MELTLFRVKVFLFSLVLSISACNNGGSSNNSKPEPQTNRSPIVDLGEDQMVNELNRVTVTANASDSDGDITQYQWQQVSGPGVSLDSYSDVTIHFVAPDLQDEPVVIELEITVRDNLGASSTDRVSITVMVDTDGDDVADKEDNCPDIANPDQLNTDHLDDGGDACDVEDDGDGLIEIYSLTQLDWIRNDLTGASLNDGDRAIDDGCPISGCIGYELMTDLDFDTNGDQVMDSSDVFFDYDGDQENNGWLPIGDAQTPFKAIFDGNGFRVSNLFIHRTQNDTQTEGVNIGLFGQIGDAELGYTATIRNLRLDGNLMITGRSNVGALVGQAFKSSVKTCASEGRIIGTDLSVGGLIGFSVETLISHSESFVTIDAEPSIAGGLVGHAVDSVLVACRFTGSVKGVISGGIAGITLGTTINACYVTAEVSGVNVGAIIGRDFDESQIQNTYWALDSTGANLAVGQGSTAQIQVLGVSLLQLQCPVAANTLHCDSVMLDAELYHHWDSVDDDFSPSTPTVAPWHFGSANQLPVLKVFNGDNSIQP